MAISIKNHEDRITALEKKTESFKITSVDLPNATSNKIFSVTNKVLLLNNGSKNITVPSLSDYNFLWFRSTHESSYITAIDDNVLVPISILKTVSKITTIRGGMYWHNQDCYSDVTYVDDTTLKFHSGDSSSSGIFSPIYLLKLYYNFSYNITREFYKVKFKLRHYLCSHLQKFI